MRRALFALLLVSLTACPPGAVRKPAQPKLSASEQLAAVGDGYWKESLRVSPTWATYLGDRSRDAEIPDVSWTAQQKHLGILRGLHGRLKALDRNELVTHERITADVLEHELSTALETAVCKNALWVVDQLGGPQVLLGELPSYHTIKTQKNADDLVTRYLAINDLYVAHVANLKMGLEQGYVAPRINVERVMHQLDGLLATETAKSPFMKAAKKLPEDWPKEQRVAVEQALLRAVEEGIYPGMKAYRDFLETNVLPKSRTAVGVSWVPRGSACYAAQIRHHTGSTKAPEELHELGLSEVKRLRAAMFEIIESDGGSDDFVTYFNKLKKRKGQFYAQPNKLVKHNEALVARAEAALPKAFGRLPKTPVKLKEMERYRAADAPAAYYYAAPEDGSRPAYYYLNTYKPTERPLYNMAVLAYHEAVPGHHLQIALANENETLPEFQRRMGQTAFVEGWALYAEGLADELGLYHTKYERLGMYNYEMWRAVRLVVDTGLHAKGWTRQQAIDYLTKNTGNPAEEVVNEIDRYITWPGQALAYKWGQLEIRALRKQAENTLGEKFDLSAFHDRVLMHGAVPLPTLRRDIEHWITEQSAR